ncbi:MAG: hypothetical protein E6G09_00365 [Actinobacteria bacterium]|nr:MAG: hypothetical protein E6G09_00365 [Actinomycetota bacterium]
MSRRLLPTLLVLAALISALAGLALVLLVLSAALRSPAVTGGVPTLAVSALVMTLVLYAAISVGALFPGRALSESV